MLQIDSICAKRNATNEQDYAEEKKKLNLKGKGIELVNPRVRANPSSSMKCERGSIVVHKVLYA